MVVGQGGSEVEDFTRMTEGEVRRWLWLRAVEWTGFPAFVSQPLVPIMFIFFPWYWVVAAVLVSGVLWALGRYSFVNVTIATIAGTFVIFAKWPCTLGAAIYLFLHHQPVAAVIAALWPLLSGFVSIPGKIGIIELAFAERIGTVPPASRQPILSDAVDLTAGDEGMKGQHNTMEGDARVQSSPGGAYHPSMAVAQDQGGRLESLRKAAEQGDAQAQYNIGVCYDDGMGVAQDDAEAVKWYRKAAEQGDVDALSVLGVCYELGSGVRQSRAAAADCYYKAGLGYVAKGDEENALLCYDRLVALNPPENRYGPAAFLAARLRTQIDGESRR
jgi:Sel1 repeat